MSKTDPQPAAPSCLRCGVVFYGNPVSQHARTHIRPDGMWAWICQACLRERNRLDFGLKTMATTWEPEKVGIKCGRCQFGLTKDLIAGDWYMWSIVRGNWLFHCQRCADEIDWAGMAYFDRKPMLDCQACGFLVAEADAVAEGWHVDPRKAICLCFFCWHSNEFGAGCAVPLSCTSIPQEKSDDDVTRRWSLKWLEILTLILTLAAIGGNLRCITLLLASASLAMAIVRSFAGVEKLKELLAKKTVQM